MRAILFCIFIAIVSFCISEYRYFIFDLLYQTWSILIDAKIYLVISFSWLLSLTVPIHSIIKEIEDYICNHNFYFRKEYVIKNTIIIVMQIYFVYIMYVAGGVYGDKLSLVSKEYFIFMCFMAIYNIQSTRKQRRKNA